MRVLSPLAAFVVLPALGLSACGKSTPSVSTNPDVLAATKGPSAAKGESTCLSPEKVIAGVEYTCADGKKRTGTFSANNFPQCKEDGEKGCLANSSHPAVTLSKVSPGNVKQGVILAGITGTLTSTGPAECAADGEVACVSTASFAAASTSGLADRVLSGQSVAGIAGNVTLPAASAVRVGAGFGPAGSTAGTLADCTADGAEGCVVPTGSTIKAADTTNFNGWDIRKKRNSSGEVLKFAGITSQGKSHCRNRANITNLGSGPWDGNATPGAGDWNNAVLPATAGLDFFDTIDDGNNGLTGLPGDIPAWTMLIGGQTVTAGNDFACGGIYATGSRADGGTGADVALAHDPNGNWQDITPNFAPGGQASDNLGGGDGCNHEDKHCVFRELISGLMVTEVSASTHTWQNALNYCHNLGEAGGVVTSPIPIIGGATYTDWRLPTQKEMMQLYNAGVRGLNQTSNLTIFFGSVDTNFWSSSSVSYGTSYAWNVYLGNVRHGQRRQDRHT